MYRVCALFRGDIRRHALLEIYYIYIHYITFALLDVSELIVKTRMFRRQIHSSTVRRV